MSTLFYIWAILVLLHTFCIDEAFWGITCRIFYNLCVSFIDSKFKMASRYSFTINVVVTSWIFFQWQVLRCPASVAATRYKHVRFFLDISLVCPSGTVCHFGCSAHTGNLSQHFQLLLQILWHLHRSGCRFSLILYGMWHPDWMDFTERKNLSPCLLFTHAFPSIMTLSVNSNTIFNALWKKSLFYKITKYSLVFNTCHKDISLKTT